MAEIGLIASVIQVAGAGLKLSQTLYQYADGVATADRRIKDIAKEIQLTSFVVEELGAVFKHDETSTLMSKNAVKTANETMKECSSVFAEIESTLKKSKKNTLGRFMLPFRDNKIELLRNHIDKLKSTLQLLMQVLTHAHQVASRKLDRETEAKQKAQIQDLIELKKRSAKKYEESLKNFSDDSTIGAEDESGSDEENDGSLPSREPNVVTSAIESSINPKTLETCVQHVRSLLEDIENLQQALTQEVDDDHSEHHQSLIGSYFRARGHLDSVLFSGTQKSASGADSKYGSQLHVQANSTDIQISVHQIMTRSSLHCSTPQQGTLAGAESAQDVHEAEEKARKEEQEKPQVEAEALQPERESAPPKVERRRLTSNNSLSPTTQSTHQLPIKFRDTLGTTYNFPFQSCKTWEGLHSRIKKVYARIHVRSHHAAAGRFDVIDQDGHVILPEDFDDIVQPGMSLSMNFWPDCEPLTFQINSGEQPRSAAHSLYPQVSEEQSTRLLPLPPLSHQQSFGHREMSQSLFNYQYSTCVDPTGLSDKSSTTVAESAHSRDELGPRVPKQDETARYVRFKVDQAESRPEASGESSSEEGVSIMDERTTRARRATSRERKRKTLVLPSVLSSRQQSPARSMTPPDSFPRNRPRLPSEAQNLPPPATSSTWTTFKGIDLDLGQIMSDPINKERIEVEDQSSFVDIRKEGHMNETSEPVLEIDHDSTRLASVSGDRTVKIWDASSGACLQTLEGHSNPVWSVAFSHNSARLASASGDNTVKIWDASSSACLQTLEGHSNSVMSVAFSHDSARLASASGDSTVKIWDANSGACLLPVPPAVQATPQKPEMAPSKKSRFKNLVGSKRKSSLGNVSLSGDTLSRNRLAHSSSREAAVLREIAPAHGERDSSRQGSSDLDLVDKTTAAIDHNRTDEPTSLELMIAHAAAAKEGQADQVVIPVDVIAASRVADEKRKLNVDSSTQHATRTAEEEVSVHRVQAEVRDEIQVESPRTARQEYDTLHTVTGTSSPSPAKTYGQQGLSRTAQIQAEIDATVDIMRDNINKVAQRGDRLDALDDPTDDLAVSAQAFRRAANKRRDVSPGFWSNPLAWFSLGSTKDTVEESSIEGTDTAGGTIEFDSYSRHAILVEEDQEVDEVEALLREWTTVGRH